MSKKITRHIPAYKIDMGGIILDQALPSEAGEDLDPFLLLHYGKGMYPKGGHPRDFGVGPHPHRGFSPVSFLIKGSIYHQDSRGNKQIVDTGGIQWMHSARGIIHSERPPSKVLDEGGEFEMIQLWINSPAAAKTKQPTYQPLQADEIPSHQLPAASIKVVAGEFEGTKGNIETESPLDIFMVELEKDGQIQIHQKRGYNTGIFVIEGGITTDGKSFFTKDLVAFEEEGDTIDISATASTKFLYMSGLPLKEEVVKHGPFVMNNQTEIMEAMRDYQLGKMGVLIEEYV